MSFNERRFKRQREALIDDLRERGIENDRVLRAIAAVPRHTFIDPALHHRAYNDEALPIGLNQTISQPFTVAYQSALLDPQKDERILEIGTGSGYQAAVLCEMGARVFSVERHKELHERAKAQLKELGYRIRLRYGDGTDGWPAFAPYDGIIVTAGAQDVPQALLNQLREPSETHDGGRLIIPVGGRGGQTMNRIVRTGPDSYRREQTDGFRFVPLVSED